MQKNLLLTVLLIGVVFVLFSEVLPKVEKENYPEAEEVSGTSWAFDEYEEYFETLAEEKGAEYAFDVLKRVNGLPVQTDYHLLGHVIGDTLYKQQGINGIQVCTDDFRNACSHSIVVGYFVENGEANKNDIYNACKLAPGGKGAYTMCFHGLGHGILAFYNYKLDKAVEMCSTFGTEEYNNREYIECVGGTIMEIVGGGAHDQAAWEKERPYYLKEDNVFAPCDSTFMPKEAQPICYTYLTPRFFEESGIELRSPDPKLLPATFEICDRIPDEEIGNKISCYDGVGKELIGFALDGDIRDPSIITDVSLGDISHWCGYATTDLGEISCKNAVVRNLFWGAEEDINTSIRFCNASGDFKNSCYELVNELVGYYLGNSFQGRQACGLMAGVRKDICLESL